MQIFNASHAVEILKKLSFPRSVGTDGEKEAREIIVNELKKYGYNPTLDEFEVLTFKIEDEKFIVIEPWKEEIPCAGIGLSDSTDGVEGPLKYVETGDTSLLPKENGYILLMSQRPNFEKYKEIMKRKPAGIVISERNPWRKLSRISLIPEWRKHGKAPMLYISFRNAYKLLRNRASKAKIILRQKEWKSKTFNIIAEKKGYEYPCEYIIICAHYDSVYNVPGATDNAGGTAFVLELAKAFSNLKTKRSIRFILFSAEELGLRGSLAYAKKNSKLNNIKMVINLDVHGGAIGSNFAVVTGAQEIKSYLDVLSKELGIGLRTSLDIMSSDSNSFAKYGVPAVSFARSSGTSLGMHTVDDDTGYIGPEAYNGLGKILIKLIELLANSEEFPFPMEIPEQVKKKVSEYFKKRLAIEE